MPEKRLYSPLFILGEFFLSSISIVDLHHSRCFVLFSSFLFSSWLLKHDDVTRALLRSVFYSIGLSFSWNAHYFILFTFSETSKVSRVVRIKMKFRNYLSINNCQADCASVGVGRVQECDSRTQCYTVSINGRGLYYSALRSTWCNYDTNVSFFRHFKMESF